MVRRRSTGATSCSPTDCPARGSPRLGRPPASLRGRFHRNLHPASTRQNSATTRQTDKTGKRKFPNLYYGGSSPIRQTFIAKRISQRRSRLSSSTLGWVYTLQNEVLIGLGGCALSHSCTFPDPSSASSSQNR